jgi:hypothetical protein
VFKDLFIRFLKVLFLELNGQVANELFLLLEIEALSELSILLNIVINLPGEILVESILPSQFLEYLGPLALLCVLAADVLDEGSDAVDVVGEDEAAEGLDEDEAEGFLVVGSDDIAEADGEHHGAGPVVGPDVLLLPLLIPNALLCHPVRVGTQASHARKQDADHVSKAEVGNDDLDQRPVLLVVKVFNPIDLQALYFIQRLRQFEEDDSLQVEQVFIHHTAVQQNDQQRNCISHQTAISIRSPDLV